MAHRILQFAKTQWRSPAVLIALALLPFAASLGFHAAPTVVRTPAAGPDRPALVFQQYLINYGQMYNSGRVDIPFRFFNGGKSPIKIGKVEPSCGCLTPRFAKNEYRPGESGEFTVGLLTTHQKEGENEFSVTVNYEDPQPRSATVAFKLNIRRQVTVRPSQLIFYQNGSAETEQTFVLSDMRKDPLRVLSADCKSKLVSIRVDEPVDEAESGRSIKVHVKVAAHVPPEGESTDVQLVTDDPRFPRIPIPLRILDTASAILHAKAQSAEKAGRP